MSDDGEATGAGGTRAGMVALVGRPNAGKSTLLNAFTGEHLSIVTPRAQTTRERVLGIHTSADTQIVFVDTPGLLEPRYLLQKGMLDIALSALRDADAVLLLLDATRPDDLPPGDAAAELARLRGSLVVAVNKIDSAGEEEVERLGTWARETYAMEPVLISAATGAGVDALRERLAEMLPESPFLYPEEDLAVQPVRFFVQELVRETIFEQFEEEVPYSSVVRIEEYREATDPVYIRATIFVERDTQKGILIGHRGAAIRDLGTASREKIESFVGARVYLDLRVKTMPGWRKKASSLRMLGYHVPDDDR